MTGRVSRILICLILGIEMLIVFLAGCSGTRHKDRFQWAEFVRDAVEYKAAHKNSRCTSMCGGLCRLAGKGFMFFHPTRP